MRRFYIAFIALLTTATCFGQQDPLYSQYLTNPMIFNPAYAGLNNALNVSTSFRNQWAGFDGAPTTLNFNSHMSLADNKVGIGAMFITDKAGALKNTDLELLGSYKLNLDKYVFSFGMQFGFMNSSFLYSKINIPNPNDPVFQGPDTRYSWPNVGVGAILKGEQFIVGVSIPRMMRVTAGPTNSLIASQHLYIYGGYVYYLGTRLRLKPSALIRAVKGSPLSADLNFNINIDTKYSAGVFARNFKNYGVLLQAWIFGNTRFGYAFELPTNGSVGTQFTTHELTLAFKVGVLNAHERSYSEF